MPVPEEALKHERSWMVRNLLLLVLVAGLFAFHSSWIGNSTTGGALQKDLSDHLSAGAQLPSRAQLLDRFFQQRKVLLVYGGTDRKSAAAYQKLVEGSLFPYRRGIEVTTRSHLEVDRQDLKETSVLLVGTPASNRVLSDLLPHLPVEASERGFRFQGHWYRDSRDHLFLLHPNPLDREFPLFVWMANRDEALWAGAQRLFNLGFDYMVLRGADRLLLGSYARGEDGGWRIDSSRQWDFLHGFQRAFNHRDFEVFTFGSNADWSASTLSALIRQREDRLQAVSRFFGKSVEALPTKLRYYFYPSLESKALHVQDMSAAQVVVPESRIHLAAAPEFREEVPAPEVALFSAVEGSGPSHSILERGLEVYFSRNWGRKGYLYWAARLFRAGIRFPLAGLLENSLPELESPLIVAPVAGAVVAFLLEQWGKEKFLSRYRQWDPLPGEVARLQEGWAQFMERQASRFQEHTEKDRRQFQGKDRFHRGFNFTHEGYSIFNGYGSGEADRSLERLAAMGVNSVSIVPYGFLAQFDRPVPIGVSWGRVNSENDEAVVHAAAQARRLGMTVLLKPQIWVRGSWPGSLEMKGEQQWQEFFSHYERWIRHYAMLAEIHQMDLLCIGVELSRATLGQQQQWRQMAGRLRQLYSGPMVYAANWGEEFEELTFWDAFDYIGVNAYYPLSAEDEPGLDGLREGAEKMVAKLDSVRKRFDKPLLITEIGFTSAAHPWKQPHRDHRGNETYPDRQADCYRAVFEALEGKSWCRGIFWWKWPTWLEAGDRRGGGFISAGKPAARVVAEHYRTMESGRSSSLTTMP